MTEPLTDNELAVLESRYTEEPVPVCPVCGDKLTVQKCGGGEPTIWACSPWEDDPCDPNRLRFKAGRDYRLTKEKSQHYDRSRFVQRRQGDELVLRTVAELRRLRRREMGVQE